MGRGPPGALAHTPTPRPRPRLPYPLNTHMCGFWGEQERSGCQRGGAGTLNRTAHLATHDDDACMVSCHAVAMPGHSWQGGCMAWRRIVLLEANPSPWPAMGPMWGGGRGAGRRAATVVWVCMGCVQRPSSCAGGLAAALCGCMGLQQQIGLSCCANSTPSYLPFGSPSAHVGGVVLEGGGDPWVCGLRSSMAGAAGGMML